MIVRLALVVFFCLTQLASAQEAVRIIYLGAAQDPHYEASRTYTGLTLKDNIRPIDGARIALKGTKILGRALGLKFEMEERFLDGGSAADAIAAEFKAGAAAILLDLPDEMLAEVVAQGLADGPLINIRQSGPQWRCAPNLLHTAPSILMQTDALAQFLRFRGWSKVLILVGDSEADETMLAAVTASTKKFGLTTADIRKFELTNDPRRRDLNNISLLTGGVRYDVVWLVDADGEFGRYVPYSTFSARPVVGSEGLSATAWHWTFERYGAPQLNQRFKKLSGRDMGSADWAAWIAVQSVVNAVTELGATRPDLIRDHMRQGDLNLDLYKGVGGSFRSWNGQLRQPILLTTHNAVIAVAPLPGFEHQVDTLDTLGAVENSTACAK